MSFVTNANALSILALAVTCIGRISASAMAQTIVTAQTHSTETTAATAATPARTRWTTIAAHADNAPAIDGRDTDRVWRLAPAIDAFTEWQPSEGRPPRFRTEAKVAYDAANLYVFVRAFDPHPDSIIKILERRDTSTPSDMIWVIVDSYDDHRTGFKFGVNAAGVKIDQAMYDDGSDDVAWDGVWDVATQVDSLGWTAEFRIPMSQLRYARERNHVFGFGIDRDIYRYNQRIAWPALSAARPGLASQLGMLTGRDDVEAPRRLEASPYVVTKRASQIVNNKFGNPSSVAAGGDISYRLASNVTLDATVNPDFGQVESDPAVLNLTAYESFFDERRPFFVAGRGLFRFGVNCNQVNCGSEGLYYSRRIGRTPELAGTYGDTVPLTPTTILGAAKLVGRFLNGLTLGVLDAGTQRASSPGDTTFEPATNYFVTRVTQDLDQGNTTFGALLTAVNRGLDRWSAPSLASNAYVGGVDFRRRFLKNRYEISGSLDESRVRGSRMAILALQRDAVHYYQRPDGGLALDSTRTVLGGDAEEFKFDKVGGQHLLFESAYQRRSPGFEPNDLGFLRRADEQSWSTWIGYFDRREHLFYQSFHWNNNWWQDWTDNGLALQRAYATNLHITFKNNWGWHMGSTLGQLGATYDDRSARGGPAIRQSPYVFSWLTISGDDRRVLLPSVRISSVRGDGGRSVSSTASAELDYKLSGRFSSALSVNWSRNVEDNQWYGNFTDSLGATHYAFAHLDQTTRSATVRLNYTFTPNVSLQTYMQPFVSNGAYSDVRQLSSTPRATTYDAHFVAYGPTPVTSAPGGFDIKELQSNVVVRWEYRPGSILFLVWNEGRQGSLPAAGNTAFTSDMRDILRLHPANTFLVKLSYWLNR
jgi:hypothetical protein